MKVFKRKRAGAEVTRTEAMHCIPVKNSAVQESCGESGQVLLGYDLEVRPSIGRLIGFFFGSAERIVKRKLQLDELGTLVWNLLDGQRSVGQVVQEFAAIQRLHPREAETAVTLFLRQLGKRGLIGMK